RQRARRGRGRVAGAAGPDRRGFRACDRGSRPPPRLARRLDRGARLPDGRAPRRPRGQGPGRLRVGDDDRARARGRARDDHAPRLARHPRRLSRALLRHTVWERVPFLVLALAAFVAAEPAPGLALGVLLAMLLIVTGVGGVLMPAWMDIVGRAIPVTLRGRFFALANLAASAVGFAG